jgi:hypothetical protein
MERYVGQRVVAAVLIALAAIAGGAAATASAQAPAGDVAVTHFATGFESDQGIGPIGLAFDALDRLYVADNHNVYRFAAAGGDAGSHRITSRPISGRLFGLAFGSRGELYAARQGLGGRGDVVELDPSSGQITGTVASGIPCPLGVAVEPGSGDVFVSTGDCGKSVLRLHDGQATPFIRGLDVDGLTFGGGGTLFIAHHKDANGYNISSVTPGGTRTPLAAVPNADGIALASSEGNPPFLIVNRTSGQITSIDLNGGATRDLVSGGSRGDFVTVGSDGCLFATQTDQVLKVTNPDGSCRSSGDSSSTGALGPGGLAPTGVRIAPLGSDFVQLRGGASRAKSCRTNRKIKVRFRAPGGVKVTRARIFVKGRYNRTVSGKALRRSVTVKKLPIVRFTLTIRAKTQTGRTIVVHRKYKACAGR